MQITTDDMNPVQRTDMINQSVCVGELGDSEVNDLGENCRLQMLHRL